MNTVYLKFLKRYLQVPKSSPTEICYLVCGTIPMSERIFQNPTKALSSINLSIPFPGHQLSLVKKRPPPEEPFEFQREVPVQFWEILQSQFRLPTDSNKRRKFTSKLFDLQHWHNCNRNKSEFHNTAEPQKCKCKHCKQPMDWYHIC